MCLCYAIWVYSSWVNKVCKTLSRLRTTSLAATLCPSQINVRHIYWLRGTCALRLCVYAFMGGAYFPQPAFVWSLPLWGSRTLSLPRDRENGNLSRNAHTAEAMWIQRRRRPGRTSYYSVALFVKGSFSNLTVTVTVTDDLFKHELQKSPALPPSCPDSGLRRPV